MHVLPYEAPYAWHDEPFDWISQPVTAAAETYVDLVARQVAAFYAISNGDCTPSCAAATKAHSTCVCGCDGAYHGLLWADGIAPDDDGNWSRDRLVRKLGAVQRRLSGGGPSESELRHLFDQVYACLMNDPTSVVTPGIWERMQRAMLAWTRGG